ncbi:MAG TPA: efflux RND transporter periplasmic adaptor subunit [Verrucomicrobiae bacterium]|nr:efflux RND transporter periplasmic adaptor subunit [Verrucomicrobiae bacterium]
MNTSAFISAVLQRLRRHPVIFGAIAVAAVAVVVVLVYPSGAPALASSSFEVRRGDFLISIVEGGTIEAVNEDVIRSDVEGTARIIFIVPEGSTVKKGDLLVELDSSSSQDAVNQQQINVEKAQLAVIQAEQTLEIQKSTVASEVDAAKLKVEFAQSDFNKYDKGEALQLRRNAQIEITNVLETLSINLERLDWTEALYKQRFETKANLDKDRLAVSQAKLKLEQAQKALWMLETFDEPKRKRELEALLKEATDNLDRVKLQGESKLAQYRADVQTQKKTLDLNLAKLERDKKQLQATKIYAPQDGLVVFGSGGGGGGGDRRFSSESMIEEGAVVRNRQEIIKLPDVSHMKLTVRIHESHINQIRPAQTAFVVLDSMPDRRFRGVVGKVAPIPDSSSRWGNPNLKVYLTEIRITDDMPDVKPGVSARAEIVITNLASVLTVPIQSVTTRKGQQVVFLAGASPRPVPVQVGMYNNKFIEIASGLEEGDRVLLAPPFDTEGKDLGGALIAKGGALPQVDSNEVRRTLAPDNGNGDRSRGGEGRLRGESNGRGFGQAPGAGLDPSAEGAAGGERRGRFGGPGGGSAGGPGGANFPSREEMMKQFDKNGDGQLDEEERAAMRARFGSRRRDTNAPPTESGP